MNHTASPPPLTDKDYTDLNRHLDELARLQADINRAAAAGVDCTEPTSHCAYLISQLQAIKRAYFPDRP